MRLESLVLFVAALIFGGSTAAGYSCELPAGIDAETGFRMERYKAPVPDCIPGGRTLGVSDVTALDENSPGTILVDVYPPLGGGPDLLDGTWRLTESREHIAGSIWLPNVGRGFLERDIEAYFRRNLERLTGGDKSKHLVFYCTADCWQGWNAARRAISWGYSNVSWFPLGSDGWRDLGLPVVAATPVNFLEE